MPHPYPDMFLYFLVGATCWFDLRAIYRLPVSFFMHFLVLNAKAIFKALRAMLVLRPSASGSPQTPRTPWLDNCRGWAHSTESLLFHRNHFYFTCITEAKPKRNRSKTEGKRITSRNRIRFFFCTSHIHFSSSTLSVRLHIRNHIDACLACKLFWHTKTLFRKQHSGVGLWAAILPSSGRYIT